MAVSAVIMFFFIHTIIALAMISVGTLYHIDNNQYTRLTREDINSVPSLTIAVGILMILFILGSCIIRNMYNKEGYIMMSLLLLMLQLAASIHGCIKINDDNGSLNTTLQEDMKENIMLFNRTKNIQYIYQLSQVQNQLKCCGVNSFTDYNIFQLPASCCPHQKSNKSLCDNTEVIFKDGCGIKVYEAAFRNIGSVAYVTIILSIIQVFGTLYITVNLVGLDQILTTEARTYHHF